MVDKTAHNQFGFTIVELLLVISLMVIILALSVPNLFSPLGAEKVNNLSKDIIALLNEAQTKAVSSETLAQGTTSEFGIHFTNNNYTLFRGTIYNPADTTNFQVSVPFGLSIVPNLPCPVSPNNCNNLIFARLNGEIQNFDLTKNSLCLADNLNNKVKIITNFVGVTDAQTAGC